MINPTRIFGLALLFSLPLLAQGDLGLKGTLGDIPKAPTPKDQFGNPIAISPPTPAEIEAGRLAQKERAEKIQAEEERQASERQRKADEERAAARRAEEQHSQNRNNTAIYVVLAVGAALLVSRFFKRGG